MWKRTMRLSFALMLLFVLVWPAGGLAGLSRTQVAHATTTGTLVLSQTTVNGPTTITGSVSAAAFNPGDFVTITLHDGGFSQGVGGGFANSNGTLVNANIYIPSNAPASTTATLTPSDNHGNSSSPATLTIYPVISISPNPVTPGANITITGTNFDLTDNITIYFSNAPGVPVATTPHPIPADATNGSISATYTMPSSGLPSNLNVQAVGATTGDVSMLQYVLNITGGSTGTRQITLNPTSAAPGGYITVSGSGFTGSLAYIYFSGLQSPTTLPVSAGTISGSVQVPSSVIAGQTYSVTAYDLAGYSNAVSFLASGSSGTRQITVNPTSQAAGTYVSVSGTGFSGSTVAVYFTGVPSPTTLTVSGGTINGLVQVPTTLSAGQTYSVSAFDGTGYSNAVSFLVSGSTGTRQISLNPVSAAAGSYLTVSGSGFTGATVYIYFGGVQSPSTLPVTSGNIYGSVQVPTTLSAGQVYSVTGYDGAGYSQAVSFTATSGTSGRVITSISPNPAAPGTVVVVNGSGFSNGATVYLSYGTTASSSYLTANSSGNIVNGQTTVPTTLGSGQYNVVATELYNTSLSSAPYTFNVGTGPTLSAASQTSAAVGQTIQLSGSGFTNNGYVQVYFGSTPAATQVQASNTGTLTNVNVVVPVVGLGSQPISAIDMSTSKTSNALTFTISSTATGTLAVSPNSGLPTSTGVQTTTVTLVASGSQLPANSAVSITFTDAAGNVLGPLAPSVLATDGSGNYSGTVTFPAQAAGGIGTFKVTAGAQQVSGTFKVQPNLVVSPTTVAPGQTVTVTGNGYVVGSTVALVLGATQLATSPSVVTANAQGGFTAVVTIPIGTALSTYTYIYSQSSQGQQTSAVITVSNSAPTATPTATPIATPTSTQPTATPISGAGSYNAYFAEGYTGLATTNGKATFTETLNILNPTSTATTATITYFIQGGSPMTVVKQIPAQSVLRESVNADIGPDKIVAAQVSSNTRLAVTRTLNRISSTGVRLDGATTEAASAPATFWAFPEGYTGISFQEYLTLLNPGTTIASVQIVLAPQATSNAGAHVLTLTVPPQSRYTANIRSLNQGNKANSVGMLVTSSAPVVAERVEYFGDGAGSGKFGETVARGFTSSSTELRIPYGSSGGAAPDAHGHMQPVGDQDYITLLNPASSGASVHVTVGFNNALGQGLGTPQGLDLAPGTRQTVVANLAIGSAAAGPFVISISSNGPIVAESAQYYAGSPNVGLHPGIVLPAFTGATTDAFLSELSTQQADSTLIQRTAYIYNPTGTIENVSITYFGTSSSTAQASYTIPAGGAATVNVNTDVQNSLPSGAIGAEVKINGGSGGSFIVAAVGKTVDNLSYTEDFGIPLP